MSMTHDQDVLKTENLEQLFGDLQTCVRTAAEEGWAIHEVERELWRRLLRLGRVSFGQFLALVGAGDVGETLTLSGREECRRPPQPHERRYGAIFGGVQFQRR